MTTAGFRNVLAHCSQGLSGCLRGWERGKRETALLAPHPASCQASCPFFTASCSRPFPWVARSPAFLPSASLGCHLAPPSPFQHGRACIPPRRVSNYSKTPVDFKRLWSTPPESDDLIKRGNISLQLHATFEGGRERDG